MPNEGSQGGGGEVAWRLLRRSKKGVAVSGEEQGRRVALGVLIGPSFYRIGRHRKPLYVNQIIETIFI